MWDGRAARSMSRAQVRDVDRWAIEEMGVSGVVLMENAGRGATEIILEKMREAGAVRPVVLCGTGNNGGDGFVIARHLANKGIGAAVLIWGQEAKIKGDARVNYDILRKMGIRGEFFSEATVMAQAAGCGDFLIDAVLGTGLEGMVKPEMAELIERINMLQKPIAAVDIPSGLDCDTGTPMPVSIRAMCTVTFVAVKKGFLNPQARQYTGRMYVASIGIEPK
jgi:NAD(P)H-hydrate epimerase